MPRQPTFSDLVEKRYSRRDVLRGGASLMALAALPGCAFASDRKPGLSYSSVPHGLDAHHHLAPGYQARVLARWGDPLFDEANLFPHLTPRGQARAFGYNNDFLAYLPLPYGSQSSDHGLLHVNHEYTIADLMFASFTPERTAIEMAAHGGSVLEIRKGGKGWEVIPSSPYTRRITAQTPMAISGPAAGHPRMRTRADKEGLHVLGTIANCSGGVTPWGTVLMAEENFDNYFGGRARDDYRAHYKTYTVGKYTTYNWFRSEERFDVSREPNESNRFGWVVEYDPYDPESTPVKRTALGRFKHETATCVVGPDGRLVVYSGDDDYFQYLYRFVSESKVNRNSREANAELLDHGTLSVARFDEDGNMHWLPLVYGQGPLTRENGFTSQADVLIETRRAATLMGATEMDRPEGIAVHPVTQAVYVSLTKNQVRLKPNPANPRRLNIAGHILELRPPQGDHAEPCFAWDVFILAGDPSLTKTIYGKGKGDWFACPDNLTIDPSGRLWVATDGAQEAYGIADGLYGMAVSGEGRAVPRCLFRAPIGAEVCSPCFTPDGKSLFIAIQHPAEDSSYAKPSTRWPDFDPQLPPRPSVLVILREDKKEIGA